MQKVQGGGSGDQHDSNEARRKQAPHCAGAAQCTCLGNAALTALESTRLGNVLGGAAAAYRCMGDHETQQNKNEQHA